MKLAIIVCLVIAGGIGAYVLFQTIIGPPGIRAVCVDGTISKSKTNRGTCSNHGGVARWTNDM